MAHYVGDSLRLNFRFSSKEEGVVLEGVSSSAHRGPYSTVLEATGIQDGGGYVIVPGDFLIEPDLYHVWIRASLSDGSDISQRINVTVLSRDIPDAESQPEEVILNISVAKEEEPHDEVVEELGEPIRVKAAIISVESEGDASKFVAGVYRGRSNFGNVVDYGDKQYISFGESLSSPLNAKEGDIVTFLVKSFIIEATGNTLTWTEAEPLFVDSEVLLPYFANQVVDMARRGNVLEGEA